MLTIMMVKRAILITNKICNDNVNDSKDIDSIKNINDNQYDHKDNFVIFIIMEIAWKLR